jgi:hypothetical protein
MERGTATAQQSRFPDQARDVHRLRSSSGIAGIVAHRISWSPSTTSILSIVKKSVVARQPVTAWVYRT